MCQSQFHHAPIATGIMHSVQLTVLLVLTSFSLVTTWIIPEELPTLLSFLYTNIPPVFKGTDSRVGVGFRLGPNADFQVQLELGPQTRTQKLGPDGDGSAKKRHVVKPSMTAVPAMPIGMPDTPNGWLKGWKAAIGKMDQNDRPHVVEQPKLDFDTVQHLQQLYKEQPTDETKS